MKIQSGVLSFEGDQLYYKIRGEGRAILFIAPGGGNGDDYLPVANVLADSYKVITYDRRANGRSTRHFPRDFSIRQQSRDAVAVLKEAGEAQAFVVGNSSGAVIALDMATVFPEHVHAAVIHEAPLYSVLPDADRWRDFFRSCHQLAQDKGAAAGARKFFFGVELPALRLLGATIKLRMFNKQEALGDEPPRMSSQEASDVLLLNELLPVTGYEPDIEAAMAGAAMLYIGCSRYGLKKHTWYAQTAKILAERLGRPLIEFPGHHGSFMDQPLAWAAVIRDLANRWNQEGV